MGEELELAKKEPTSSTWLSTNREILWGPLMWAIDGLLLLLAYGDLASKIFPDADEVLKKLAVLSSLPWYWKVIILLSANILLMGRGALTALKKRERQLDSYKEKLKPGLEIIPALKQQALINALGYFFEVLNPSFGTSVEEAEIRLIDIQPDPLGWLPVDLHIKHDNLGAKGITFHPRSQYGFDLMYRIADSIWLWNVVLLGEEVRLPAAEYTLTIMANGKNTAPAEIKIKVELGEGNGLRFTVLAD